MSDLSQPWHKELFYYTLHAELDRLSAGKKWRFAEVRCDCVLGFVPQKNPNNLYGMYNNFLSVYKYMHEKGHRDAQSESVPFPAPPASAATLFQDGGQDIFARFSIYLCLHPERAGNSELYNIGDSTQPLSMADRWPTMCKMYGLVGAPAVEKDDPRYLKPVSFVYDHMDMVKELLLFKGVKLQEVGLDTGKKSAEEWMESFTKNHDFVLDKARSTGFTEEMSFEESFGNVLGRYARAKKVYLGESA
jgi:nucleoside-diphosphate-sugar epimerase